MIYVFSVILIIVYKLFFKKLLNPLSISLIMLNFQLVIGSFVRSLSYPVSSNYFLDFSYLIFGFFLIVGFFSYELLFSRLQKSISFSLNFKKTIDNSAFYLSVFVFILSALLLVEIMSVDNLFSYKSIRLFYIDQRSSGISGAYIYIIGLIGPILAAYYFVHNNKILFLIVFICLLLTGKKAPVFLFILLTLIQYYNDSSVSKKKLGTIVIIGAALLISLLFLGSSSSLSYLEIFSGYFAYYESASTVFYSVLDGSVNFKPFEISISRLWKLIPRIFYESKPILYGYNLIHDAVFTYDYRRGFTIGISSKITVPFVEFGIIGVMVYGFINGIYVCVISRLIIKSNSLIEKFFWCSMLINGLSIYAIVIFKGFYFLSKIVLKKHT